MILEEFARGETWMTEKESAITHQLVTDIAKLLQSRGVAENPLLAFRVSDLTVAWILTRRLEDTLAQDPMAEEGPAPTTSAQVEAIGKTRERVRKSIKDLEDYCTRAGTPIDTGLADTLKPVIQQVQGPNPFFTPPDIKTNID